jgi:subtilisin family serine protease
LRDLTLIIHDYSIPKPKFWTRLLVIIPTENEVNIANTFTSFYPYVRSVQVNEIYSLLTNDPLFSSQHSLYSTTYPNGHINLLPALAVETGKSNIKVGVYDSGIMYKHQDLSGYNPVDGKIRGGKDYYTGGDITSIPNFGDPIVPQYYNGHGTKVAGIIGAYHDNSTGVVGIGGGHWPHSPEEGEITDPDPSENKGVSLYAFRVITGGILTASETSSALIEGASHTNNGWGYGLHILNCSFTKNYDPLYEFPYINLMYDAQRACFKNNAVLIASKGNTGTISEQTPAYSVRSYWVVAVGGSDTDGKWDSGSSFGGSSFENEVDLIAPFENSMVMTTGNNSATEYTSFSGTSSSAPHVSGVAALMLSHINDLASTTNNLTADDVENLLHIYSRDIDTSNGSIYSTGYDKYSGYGLLDAGNVLTHIDRTQYVVRHFYGQTVFDTSNPNFYVYNTQTMNGYDDGVNPPDDYKVEIWNLNGTHNHTLNPGDVILNSWSLNSYTNMIEGVLGYYAQKIENRMYLGAGVSNTSASWSGFVYHLIEDGAGNPIDLWYPFKPGDMIKYGYTLHFQSNYASVQENIQENKISCYPNPTNSNITLDFNINIETNVVLTIINSQGKMIKEMPIKKYSTGQQTLTLGVNDLAPGVYFIKLEKNDESYYAKFIKQ